MLVSSMLKRSLARSQAGRSIRASSCLTGSKSLSNWAPGRRASQSSWARMDRCSAGNNRSQPRICSFSAGTKVRGNRASSSLSTCMLHRELPQAGSGRRTAVYTEQSAQRRRQVDLPDLALDQRGLLGSLAQHLHPGEPAHFGVAAVIEEPVGAGAIRIAPEFGHHYHGGAVPVLRQRLQELPQTVDQQVVAPDAAHVQRSEE